MLVVKFIPPPTQEMTSRVGDIQVVSPLETSRYRPEIDGLRAFAVVAVIINHFNKDILPGGYLGVDIFFVISGYVITSSLFGRSSKDFKDFISGFYERRVKRLFPALIAFVVITGALITLFNPAPDRTLLSGLTSLVGVSNIYFFSRSTDYFAMSTALNPFTHTWSLGVEEQFYLLFPFLIWFSGFGRQTKNGARNLFLIVFVLTIASLVGFLYLYPTNQPAAYFLMPSRFWEMSIGCLIFIGFQKRVSFEQSLERVPPLLVLTLIVGVMFLPPLFATVSTILIVLLSSILIASLKSQTKLYKVFTHPAFVHIGLISYSLYLWHWSILTVGRWTIGISSITVLPLLVLTLLFAEVSYTCIEQPMRNMKYRDKSRLFILAGLSLVVASGSLILLQKHSNGLYAGLNIKYGKNAAPRGGQGILGSNQIMNNSNPVIITTGDSFAGHYYPALDHALGWHGEYGLIHVRGSGIDAIDRDHRGSRNYEYLSRVVDHYLASDKIVKLLIFSVEFKPKDFSKLKTTLAENIERLSRANVQFLIIGPTPYFREGVFSLCREEWFRPRLLMHSTCAPSERKKILAELEPYNRYLSQVENEHLNVHVFRPFSHLCPATSSYCSPMDIEGSYMYHDANHLSEVGSLHLAKPLFELLAKILK